MRIILNELNLRKNVRCNSIHIKKKLIDSYIQVLFLSYSAVVLEEQRRKPCCWGYKDASQALEATCVRFIAAYRFYENS